MWDLHLLLSKLTPEQPAKYRNSKYTNLEVRTIDTVQISIKACNANDFLNIQYSLSEVSRSSLVVLLEEG